MKPQVFYSVELCKEICLQVAEGKSVSAICRADGMPTAWAFYKWLREYPEHVADYTYALSARAHLLADQTLEIADEVVGKDDAQRQRLRVDTRKWAAGTMLPKVYGLKVGVGGADDLPPVRMINATMTPAEAYALMTGSNAVLPKESLI